MHLSAEQEEKQTPIRPHSPSIPAIQPSAAINVQPESLRDLIQQHEKQTQLER